VAVAAGAVGDRFHATPDGLAAAFQYAADVLKGEHTWELRITA
jgi:hypothetical protein